MKLSYASKVRIVKYVQPLLIIVPCMLLGYQSAQTLLSADSRQSSGFRINTDQLAYRSGQNVSVTLSNATAGDVIIANHCPHPSLTVEKRQTNGEWTALDELTDADKCADEPSEYIVSGNTSIKTDYHYWPKLFIEPGRYRITVNSRSLPETPYTEFVVL